MAGDHTRWRGLEPEDRSGGVPAASFDGASLVLQLLALAGRGFRPPALLVVDEVEDGDGAEDVPVGLRMGWSLHYRELTATGPRTAMPFAIYLLGVNPPSDVGEDELATFNDFYTNVHLPEVATRRGALRATRYELVSADVPPRGGAPRFLATYEVDERGAANRRHQGPPYERGPEVWQRHTTPWRVWYRVIGGGQPTGV